MERVGAILEETAHTVKLIGFGTYVGDEPCPLIGGIPNPKIVLDNDAGYVWGCECWWGSEEGCKQHIEGKKIIPIKIVRGEDGVGQALEPDELQ